VAQKIKNKMDKAMFDVDNSMHNEANTSNNLFEFSPINMNHDERLNMSERKRSRKEVMHDDNAVDEILGQSNFQLLMSINMFCINFNFF
jgi:hypothetical protein